MYEKFLNKQINLEDMTRQEFSELMSEWKETLYKMGMLNVNDYTENLLNYHIQNDVRNENEKEIIFHYLRNVA